MGGAYPKNQDQIIDVGMIGNSSAESTRLLGGLGVSSPEKT